MRAALGTLGRAIAFFVGILAVTAIIASFSAQMAIIFALVTLAVTSLSMKWPIKILGLGHRGVAGPAVFAAMLATVTAFNSLEVEKEDHLAALAKGDPAQYLVELKDHDRTRWLKALERLDPEAHRAELERAKKERATRAAREEKEKVARAAREVEKRCRSDTARILAYVLSQQHVERRLRAPSTADFPSFTKVKVLTSGECSFEIVGYVDAQNGFGAMIRSHYVAKVTRDKNDDDRWRLEMMEIL